MYYLSTTCMRMRNISEQDIHIILVVDMNIKVTICHISSYGHAINVTYLTWIRKFHIFENGCKNSLLSEFMITSLCIASNVKYVILKMSI
jgi:hypothetical protein